MALKLRRTGERVVIQYSTRAASFKRLLGRRSLILTPQITDLFCIQILFLKPCRTTSRPDNLGQRQRRANGGQTAQDKYKTIELKLHDAHKTEDERGDYRRAEREQ